PAAVDNNGQTAVPQVVSAPVGSTVTYTVSDGTTAVSGSGTVGSTGMLPVVLDLSKLSDSVLTSTVTSSSGGGLATTLVKNTLPPAVPGLAAPGYANVANYSAVTFKVTGVAGMFSSLTVYDGSNWQDGFGTLDATGSLSLVLDLSRLAEGSLTATATLMNGA